MLISGSDGSLSFESTGNPNVQRSCKLTVTVDGAGRNDMNLTQESTAVERNKVETNKAVMMGDLTQQPNKFTAVETSKVETDKAVMMGDLTQEPNVVDSTGDDMEEQKTTMVISDTAGKHFFESAGNSNLKTRGKCTVTIIGAGPAVMNLTQQSTAVQTNKVNHINNVIASTNKCSVDGDVELGETGGASRASKQQFTGFLPN